MLSLSKPLRYNARMSTHHNRSTSEVAHWHLLSGAPDNVTEDGDVIGADSGLRLQVQKDLLRGEIARLRRHDLPAQVTGLARLAGSYLLAGDVETARRYLAAAREALASHSP